MKKRPGRIAVAQVGGTSLGWRCGRAHWGSLRFAIADADLWRKHRPDVTLLDLRMPMLDGVGVTAEIRKEDTSARIIMLTTYDTDNEIYRAMKAGAKGYLLKDARREELLDCIRKVNRGETCKPQTLVEKMAAGMSSETDRKSVV